jgi:H+/Cl- antiporter ClcA
LAQVLRAAIYALQSIFNPLNLIVLKPLVSVCYWWAALVSFILGLFGIITFALFLLSLRRRFKLD